MSNVSVPPPENVPSLRSLRRATVVAIVAVVALIVCVILPAERGIDITGLGRVIGLTEMGEFKVENDKEFKMSQDALRTTTPMTPAARMTKGSGILR